MNISGESIKELRNRTQAGFLECKLALTEALGDMDKAIEIIRKRGVASAVKRAGRTAKEGRIGAVMAKDGSAIFFELNSETDFVAKSTLFQQAHTVIAETLSTLTPHTLTLEKVGTTSVTGSHATSWSGKTINEMIQLVSGTLGEKLELKAVDILHASPNGLVGIYIHAGEKLAAGVCLADCPQTEATQALAKDLAMQVAASHPQYLIPEEIPSDILEKEKVIYASHIDSNKPPAIVEKIIQGKLKSFYAQVCLIHQPFIKEPKLSIEQHVATVSKQVGRPIAIQKFVRLMCGER